MLMECQNKTVKRKPKNMKNDLNVSKVTTPKKVSNSHHACKGIQDTFGFRIPQRWFVEPRAWIVWNPDSISKDSALLFSQEMFSKHYRITTSSIKCKLARKVCYVSYLS